MSGHSKWATIHRAKEANDAKKGAAFTKLANAITIAVKEGGGIGDPASNFKLRLMIEKARAVNMPKDNIQRAIDRATSSNSADFSEALYEGFLPGGVAVLVQTLSDNKLRSAQFVREAVEKHGGSMASSGAVSYLFSHKGELHFGWLDSKNVKSKEDQELDLIESGLDEYESDGENGWLGWCEAGSTFEVKEKLESMGYKVNSAELAMKPSSLVEVTDPDVQAKVETILEKLSDLDDVQKVWTNYS